MATLTKKDLLEAIEDMPKAYNNVVFLEWVRTNKLWEKLFALMYGED